MADSTVARLAQSPSISSRRDLSFTATSDDPGIHSNWSVPHDKNGYWGDTVQIGRRLFSEIEELSTRDEDEAFFAIVCALSAHEWNGAWGIEYGFSERLAAAAIVGIRALRAADRAQKEAV